MPTNRPALCAERWIIPDTVAVDALIEQVLCEQAWWIAVRTGQHAHQGVVWADCAARKSRKPKRKVGISNQFSMWSDQSRLETDN